MQSMVLRDSMSLNVLARGANMGSIDMTPSVAGTSEVMPRIDGNVHQAGNCGVYKFDIGHGFTEDGAPGPEYAYGDTCEWGCCAAALARAASRALRCCTCPH